MPADAALSVHEVNGTALDPGMLCAALGASTAGADAKVNAAREEAQYHLWVAVRQVVEAQ